MLKKILSLLLVTTLVLSLAVGCAGSGEKLTVGMITDTGGLGDQSFNDSAWDGLGKAEKDLKIERKVLESETADDYGPNLTSFAEEKIDLIIGVGFLFETTMKDAAKQFPEQKFAVVDAVILDENGQPIPNVASLTFAEHEGSFLVGVIAGMTTKTNKVGYIGGMKFPTIQKFEYGFRAGVKAVNPDAEVIVNYADSFEDSAKGKEIALAQNQMGADVIYHAAGAVGVGLIQAAEEKGFWAIGVDKDQSDLAPENVLCSMIKRVDTSTFAITELVKENKFEGKNFVYDLKNDGVGYSDKAGNLTDDLKDAADKYKEAIINGKIAVPSTEDEFNSFEIPQI
ncbi:BMP family lipoprotein [Brassicibacter mesophilus]|uniref:BMP family lipoprotein n=1 Tax=Brassicibacter mesophilus TaxID=745119 RepID=UPI003D20B615